MLPDPLFESDYSTVVYDRDDQLIGARISSDDQWRFPEVDTLSEKYVSCLLAFEDKRFYRHMGVDFLSLSRALKDNFHSGQIVSGASTITMQLMRMARLSKNRSYYQKLIEILWAFRAEIRYSKYQLLCKYASHAPFGGNVVGISAASWRYFDKDHTRLTWAEAALLAILPNNPSWVHINKNRAALLSKRNNLLRELEALGKIDATELELSLLEELPDYSQPMPQDASHFVEFVKSDVIGESDLHTTLSSTIQSICNRVSNDHYLSNRQSDIYNAAVVVLDTKSGEVLGYIGNPSLTTEEKAIDNARSHRSSGSILKPFLYASLLQSGEMTPSSLQADVPTYISGYAPKNYNRMFSGAVGADEALAKSLNVPAVLQLQAYGVDRFIKDLKELGLTTIDRSADHYGLSLIIGGAEVSLLETTAAYASLGRTLLEYTKFNDKYSTPPLVSTVIKKAEYSLQRELFKYDPGVIYSTFEAMREVHRPASEGGWEMFSTSSPVAWKTGTSFGHKDAWAVGVTPEYTIGIWVGNSDGEGRPDIIGVEKAGALLFDVFNNLPKTSWFEPPLDYLVALPICRQSGHLAHQACTTVDTTWIPSTTQFTSPCPYHEHYYVTNDEQYSLTSSCSGVVNFKTKSYFILPPTLSTYYRKGHPEYYELPPPYPDCATDLEKQNIDLIFPSPGSQVYIPKDLNGQKQKIVLKAATSSQSQKVYWHMDNEYLGSTQVVHELEMDADFGVHVITIVDENGNQSRSSFSVESE